MPKVSCPVAFTRFFPVTEYRQEYMEARAAYLDGVAAKAQADVNFQQAMDTYDWAVKGLTGI